MKNDAESEAVLKRSWPLPLYALDKTMENIQEDEETRPLSQPQRRVAEAYAESSTGSG